MITAVEPGGMPRGLRFVQALVLAKVLGVCGTAGAEQSQAAEPVWLTYAAGPECPSEAAFTSEVKARIRRRVTFTDHLPARRILVEAQADGERAHGELSIVESSGAPTTRAISAETCAEVASGLALVVALALDPNARTDPLSPTSAEVPPRAVPQVESRAPVPAPAIRPAPLRFFAGLSSGVGAGYAPVAVITAGGLLGLRYETGGLLSPSLQLAPAWGRTGVMGPNLREASFSFTLLRVDACPLRFEAARSLSFRACASSELGRVVASGDPAAISRPLEKARFWADLGPTLRSRLAFGPWFLELGGGVLVTLTRDRFLFELPAEPWVVVHDTPDLVYGANLALGAEL